MINSSIRDKMLKYQKYSMCDIFPNYFKGITTYLSKSILDVLCYHKSNFQTLMNSVCTFSGVDDLSPQYQNHSIFKSVSYEVINAFLPLKDSGDKVNGETVYISPDVTDLCNIIYARYNYKWTKLIESYKKEYNYLSPYDMNITDTTEDKLNSTDTNISNYNNSSSNEGSFEDTDSSVNNTYGINSSAIPAVDSSSTKNSSTTSTIKSNADSTINKDYNRTNNIKRTVDRIGNIGNTTRTQLTVEYREMLKAKLLDEIFDDLDEVLTRQKYYL